MTTDEDERMFDAPRDITREPVDSPTAFPGVAVAGGLLGVLLLVGCGLLVRDLLAAAGVIGGDTWVHRAAVELGHQTWSDWMWVLPAACAVIGVAALWMSVKPRHRTHVTVSDQSIVWTRRVDVARRVSAAVTDLPDVRRAVTVVGRRRVKVVVTAAGRVDTARIVRTARTAVGAIAVPGKVVVKVKTGVRA
ncbi:hypothetical protein [Gordonia phthalatica]|uniref:Alkaline shock response membrane anchor protein AmaP n=1 Tax=Gordonia phthalatica TaxID=1136941 RepID=A0A0N9MSG6_9ACTN|nr:hypothetical protein [Gordonia phthalatica]ALG86037.1 hypothetical protein ACH46_17955 [Gordonia phthalatica]